jgi:hypothetical protein
LVFLFFFPLNRWQLKAGIKETMGEVLELFREELAAA